MPERGSRGSKAAAGRVHGGGPRPAGRKRARTDVFDQLSYRRRSPFPTFGGQSQRTRTAHPDAQRRRAAAAAGARGSRPGGVFSSGRSSAAPGQQLRLRLSPNPSESVCVESSHYSPSSWPLAAARARPAASESVCVESSHDASSGWPLGATVPRPARAGTSVRLSRWRAGSGVENRRSPQRRGENC